MMKPGLSRFTRRMLRRGQTGQTIVILAFGFIVLLGFVGIVTDVSLMFVRYSTLRRAIDAAAVSAAGQMRRAVPTDAEITQANGGGGTQQEKDLRAVGYATARNITEVNLAARQFIELYGLTPTQVLVDTCATTEILPRTSPPTFSDPQLECESGEQPRKLVRDGPGLVADSIPAFVGLGHGNARSDRHLRNRCARRGDDLRRVRIDAQPDEL
jgi:hypothetical protein